MKKRSRRGESLIETLVAMLIVSLIILGLASSITVAARVNRDAERAVRSCNMAKDEPAAAGATIRWEHGSASVSITQYRDNGYYFYEKNAG